MKKLLFIPLALALLSSCEKITSDATEQPVDPESGPKIHLSFVAEQPTVKTFFDPTATAEAWEKTLSSVDALVFNAEGRLLVHRKFTASELTSKSASFAVPNTAAGTACEFYVVANRPLSGLSTKAELLALIQSDAADYNGTFAEVSTRARRSGGFVMSGSATKTLAAAGSATDVAVTLRRCVAKIAVQTSLSAEFASRYSGKVRIATASISRAASRCPLIGQGTPAPGAMTFTHTQSAGSSGEKYNNLFYLFENGTLAAGSRVLLTLEGTYDRDGDFSTTADQAPVTYTVELSGGGAGQLLRNGYYRVQVTLGGLTGSDTTVTVSVAEWETPLTQTVSLGA